MKLISNRVLIGVIIAHLIFLLGLALLKKESNTVFVISIVSFLLLNLLFTLILILVISYYFELNHKEWFKKYPVVKYGTNAGVNVWGLPSSEIKQIKNRFIRESTLYVRIYILFFTLHIISFSILIKFW